MSGGLHICIVTPQHLSANPRAVKEAAALRSAGHRITVVYGHHSSYRIETDRSILDPSWDIKPVSFGRSVAPMHVHVLQRGRQLLARGVASMGVASTRVLIAAHSPVGTDLIAACDSHADLYIAHYVAALPAAAEAARRHGAHYAFDAEDFHLGDLPDTADHKLDKDIIRGIESRYLPGAAFVTAASPMIAEAYAGAYGIALPATILNVFPRINAPESTSPRGTAFPGPSLYWFSQTIGSGRGLETAIKAISQSHCRPHLYLRGSPAKGYEATLRDLAGRSGVSDRLHFLPPAPPNDLERLGAQFDIGLVSELDETRNRQIALTNKLFSYLTSGLPIVASNIPSHRRIAPDVGAAMCLFTIGDAASLAAALDALLGNSDHLCTVRAHAWELGQRRYSWENEMKVLYSVLSQVPVCK